MAHIQQQIFVESILSLLKNSKVKIDSVLEFGSYDNNGSVRKFLNSCDTYLGIDIVSGPGVDLVYDGINLNLDSNYSLCISCEVFEHDINWVNTFKNMINYSKEDGYVLFTCASKGRVEHGTPRSVSNIKSLGHEVFSSYYKNLNAKDFEENFELNLIFKKYFFYYHKKSKDLYFFGAKNSEKSKFDFNTQEFINNLKVSLSNNEKKYKNFKSSSILRFLKTSFNFIDFPIREALLRLKDERFFQNYMVTKFRIKDFLYKRIFKKSIK